MSKAIFTVKYGGNNTIPIIAALKLEICCYIRACDVWTHKMMVKLQPLHSIDFLFAHRAVRWESTVEYIASKCHMMPYLRQSLCRT